MIAFALFLFRHHATVCILNVTRSAVGGKKVKEDMLVKVSCVCRNNIGGVMAQFFNIILMSGQIPVYDQRAITAPQSDQLRVIKDPLLFFLLDPQLSPNID